MKLHIFLLLFLVSFCAQAQPLTQESALSLLTSTIKKQHLYEAWLKPHCLDVVAGKNDEQYFYFSSYEKHKDGCPGDPQTSPKVDEYRIHRPTQKIEVRQMKEDGSITWLSLELYKH
ncbi:hypothetical protein K1X76_11555 [bacterium]|nr:hypothetical protein [bacterium]